MPDATAVVHAGVHHLLHLAPLRLGDNLREIPDDRRTHRDPLAAVPSEWLVLSQHLAGPEKSPDGFVIPMRPVCYRWVLVRAVIQMLGQCHDSHFCCQPKGILDRFDLCRDGLKLAAHDLQPARDVAGDDLVLGVSDAPLPMVAGKPFFP